MPGTVTTHMGGEDLVWTKRTVNSDSYGKRQSSRVHTVEKYEV